MIQRAFGFVPYIVLFAVALYWCFVNSNEWTVEEWALYPGRSEGLMKMVVGYNFMHGDMDHLISNLVGIVPCLFLLAFVHRRPIVVSLILMVATGLLLWTIADSSDFRSHIGASGFFYALVAFLAVYGLRKKTPATVAVSAIVLFMYGASAVASSMPWLSEMGISWQGHLSGLIVGAVYGYLDRSCSHGSSD